MAVRGGKGSKSLRKSAMKSYRWLRESVAGSALTGLESLNTRIIEYFNVRCDFGV